MLSSYVLSLNLTHYPEEERKCLNISRTLLLEHYLKDYVIFSIILSHMLSSFVLSFYLTYYSEEDVIVLRDGHAQEREPKECKGRSTLLENKSKSL